jgi:hypothetical protein
MPVPVALLVKPKLPLGAVVVVTLFVIAVVKKYTPPDALDATAPLVAVDARLAPVTAPVAATLEAVTTARDDAPVTAKLSNCGSAYATPVALLLGIIFP